MSKKIPIAMLAFLIGIFSVYLLIKIAAAGFKFGQSLATPEAHASQESRSPST